MKIVIEHFCLRSTDRLDRMVEEHILALEPRLRIDEATVRLAYRHELSPSFRADVHLVTPGPDLRVTGRGCTVRAAFDAALAEVVRGLDRRRSRRVRRLKADRQAPADRRRRN